MSRSLRRAAAFATALILAAACDRDDETGTSASASTEQAATSSSATTAAGQPPFEPEKVDFVEPAMGTRVHFVAYTTPELDEPEVRRAFGKAMAEIRRLEKLMSSWRDDSDVAAINAAAGQPVKVSPETFQVFEKSLWASRLSDGAFDVTFAVMKDLWKFGEAAEPDPKLPAPEVIDRKKRLIDYRKVELSKDERTVAIGANQRVGLGGIAKGYIVDRAARVLRGAGLSSFLVQAGGDLYGAGRKPDGAPWVSGIQDPRGEQGEFFAVIELEDHAFSTAGDYARAFIEDGKRYHHIIDPRTGYPATKSRSVTLWGPDALTADALDDAVFIIGPEKGLELVESLPGAGAVIVDAENRVHISQRLEGKVRVLEQPTGGL